MELLISLEIRSDDTGASRRLAPRYEAEVPLNMYAPWEGSPFSDRLDFGLLCVAS